MPTSHSPADTIPELTVHPIRIIPRLDIKGPNLVKGIHLEGLRVLGKPEFFSQHYYQEGADELLYMDVVASLYGRNNLLDIVKRTASRIFVPLTVGGGLRSLQDIQDVLTNGADKIALNTAAVKSPQIISHAAQRFGSSTIVVSIEVLRTAAGRYQVYTDNGREPTDLDAIEWARQAAELGAGELLITSIDQEGTGKGFELDLVRSIATAVDIPVIAGGGAGCPLHVQHVIEQAQVSAVAIASMLHYQAINSHPKHFDLEGEGNIHYLQKQLIQKRVVSCSIPELKKSLALSDISCRPI